MAERFKRLYLSKETAQPMRWSMEEKCEHDDDIMMHPRDGEAWHALDRFDPEFASDPRSIRFGLPTDGPKHPRKNLNVFLEQLIEELQELWIGVEEYDGKAIKKRRPSKRLKGEQIVEWLDKLVDDDDGGFFGYELSYFYRQLCAKVISKKLMREAIYDAGGRNVEAIYDIGGGLRHGSTIVFQGRQGEAKGALLAGRREPSKKLNRRKLTLSQKLGGDVLEFRPPQPSPQVLPNYFSSPINQEHHLEMLRVGLDLMLQSFDLHNSSDRDLSLNNGSILPKDRSLEMQASHSRLLNGCTLVNR
ncbi:hypothetical protein U9M48_027368 [Paspalum notatum var. saurae]|uniref:Uncharacterized protein n=1 Tax=Paspalum notatum var. saurae TaxID=547442 RepID=A0AAQ3X013_PASNO